MRRWRIVAGVEACQNFQKERYAMKKTTDIIALRQPETVEDPLTEIARDGARRMLAAALGAEADAFVAEYAEEVLPKWARRSRSLDALLPVLYLRGISTGDFQETLAAILGKDAPNLSPRVISRLTGEWQQEYDRELCGILGDAA